MSETDRFGIGLMASAQSQKHVTMNEALVKIENILHVSVISRTTTAPPGSPTAGDQYLVPTGATGAWSGHEDEIATYNNGAWVFETAINGMTAWVRDETTEVRYNGLRWALSTFLSLDLVISTVDVSGVLTVTGSLTWVSPPQGQNTVTVTSITGAPENAILILRGTTGNTITISVGNVSTVFTGPSDHITIIKIGSNYFPL